MQNNFHAIVVVYNKRCEDSSTCAALKNISNVNVLIYDNSTTDMENEEYCNNIGWKYLGGKGNVGLSKAYNAGIEFLLNSKAQGYVCLFDDDTSITADYFDKLGCNTKGFGADIFVPIIKSEGSLISPCKLSPNFVVTQFNSAEAALNYKKSDISAINSGMAISLKIFENYRYDENIFLDGIDHKFILDMKADEKSIKVFDYSCNHSFSGTEKPDINSALKRFRIFKDDHRYILRNKRMAYFRLVGKRALRLCLQYKTISFLFA